MTGIFNNPSIDFAYNPANEGSSFLGGPNLRLGPCLAFYGNFNTANLSGTISCGTAPEVGPPAVPAVADDDVAGSGTDFQTDLKVGDVILASNGALVRVISISSDTALKVSPAVYIPAASTYKKVDVIDMGGTDSTTLAFGLEKTDLMESQKGTTAADKAVSGYNCSVTMGLTRATPERLQAVNQGIRLIRDTTTAAVESIAFGFPAGETDLEITRELRLIRIRKGAPSTDPLDVVRILKAAPTSSAEQPKDASTQEILSVVFTGYIDEETVLDGMPLIFILGANLPE